MTHPVFPLYAAIGLIAGPIWFFHGFQNLRKKRLLENTPTAKIRSMAMGFVEVQGQVASRSTLIAPFSGRACAHWEVDISTRAGRQGWRRVHHAGSGQPFFISDETGTALVYPQGAEFNTMFQVEEECVGPVFPPGYEEYMRDHCGVSSNLWRLGILRFRERILEDSQAVFIMGTATPRSRALVISDGEAMEATGTDGRPALPAPTLDAKVSAVIRQGQDEKTFIVSQQPQSVVEFGLGLHAFAGVLGGPAVTLFGLAWLLDRLSHGKW
jgi:hypothetical protein